MKIIHRAKDAFWNAVGMRRPRRDGRRRQKFRAAVQDFVVTGVLGAFAFAFALNVMVDLHAVVSATARAGWTLFDRSWAFDLNRFDRAVRYAYLAWLVSYFLVASVSNKLASEHAIKSRKLPPWSSKSKASEVPGWIDIAYDIIQSIGSFVAAACLGFILPGGERHAISDYTVTVAAIFVIFALAWFFFRGTRPDVNRIRVGGMLVSIGAIVVGVSEQRLGMGRVTIIATFAIIQLSLWCLLAAYVRVRWDVGVDQQEPLLRSGGRSRRAFL
jgi:hypothetical protein